MSLYVFEGVPYRAPELASTLRAAARGSVPSEDPDAVMNPQAWIDAFVRGAAASPLRDALVQTVAELALSDDTREAQLGATIQSKTSLLDGARVAAAAVKQSAAGRFDAAGDLLYSLVAAGAAGKPVWDPSLRDLARWPENRDLLVSLLGDYDRDWLVEHAAELLGSDAATATARAGAAARGLDAAGIRALASALRASLDRAGSPVGAAVESALEGMASQR